MPARELWRLAIGEHVDMQVVHASWKSRGFSCAVWVDPPGQVWEDYVHPTDELLLILDGCLELEIDGYASRPTIGEEVLIPARTRHTVRNVG